jgi:hypothetical protein
LTRRRTAVLLVVPLALAACGGGKHASTTAQAHRSSALDAVRGAALKAVRSGTEHADVKVDGATAGAPLRVTGSGSFDNRKRLGSFHLEFTLAGLAGWLDEVTSGTALYVKSPLFAASLPPGKTWIRLDVRSAAASQGVDLSGLLSQDPSRALRALQSLKRVTTVGKEQLASGPATHYRAHVDRSKLPPTLRRSANAGAYDVWVGDDGYIHRVRTTVGTTTGGSQVRATIVVDLSDFGKAVHVALPARDETVNTNGSIPGLRG